MDSSDKENSKYSHRPRRLNNQPPVSNSIESGRSGPKIKFDVSDLLESSDYTLDEDRVSTAVRHQNKDSISTSEVNEQLKRSKALLAELNMKRMGIPSSGHANGSKVKMNRSLNDSNVSSIPVSDVVSKENQYDLNMQRPDSHFSDENQSSDFNNRLMKLSRAATDLRSRLSHETKTLADKINPSKYNINFSFLDVFRKNDTVLCYLTICSVRTHLQLNWKMCHYSQLFLFQSLN